MPLDGYKQNESELQAAICELLDVYASQGRIRYWHVPNELPRPSILAKLVGKQMVAKIYALIEAALKRVGKKPGVLDLTIIFRNGPVVFAEVKTGEGVISRDQASLIGWLADSGHHGCVVRSVEDVQALPRFGFTKAGAA